MAKKIEMLNDQQEVVHPLTSSDCVIMENGKTLEEVMGDGIATPTVTHEGASFQVGVGDSNIEVVDGDVAGMTLEGQTYQNILPKPTTLIMETDEKEFKINDKIDNNIVLDDNVAEIATIKGQTYVNVVQEESATEYTVLGEELSGQSITTTSKPDGVIKNATLEGMTLVNTIQEPSEANSVVLDLDADINAQSATIDNTVQGGIKSAILKGQTLVNLIDFSKFLNTSSANKDGNTITITSTNNNTWFNVSLPLNGISYGKTYIACWDSLTYTHQASQGLSQLVGVYSYDTNGNQITVKATEKNQTTNYLIFTFPSNTDLSKSTHFRVHATTFTGGEGSTTTIKGVKVLEYQEGMENWDIPYFEGMQSVKMPVLKATGKNLFNYDSLILNKYQNNETYNYSIANNTRHAIYKLDVKANTTYSLDIGRSGVFYDINNQPISWFYSNQNTITTPNNCKYIIINFIDYATNDYAKAQIEEGSTATQYETFKSNILTVNEDIELRGIGDVKDELDLTTGKLTQRIGEIVLDGSEKWNYSGDHVSNEEYIVYHTGITVPINSSKLGVANNLPYDAEAISITSFTKECIYINSVFQTCYIRIKRKRGTIVDYLTSNPITVQYELEAPTIKTVDLSIVDQNNNPVKSIQTHPTLTHVSTSSQGLIPNIVIPSQLKYSTIIKPSTTYTVQLKHTTVNSDNPLTINLGGTTMAVPSTKFTITTPETLTSQDVIFTGKNNVIGEVVITEGDTTGIEYNYFEGMNDVKSPKMIAVGKNLFDYSSHPITLEKLAYTDGQQVYWTGYIGVKTYVPVKENTTYTYSNDINVGIHFGLVFYDGDKSVLSYINIFETNNSFTSFTTPKGCKFIRFAMETQTIPQWIQLEESSTATSYEPYKGVTIEQDIDSIPLTSDMFEQGYYDYDKIIKGMSIQQIPLATDSHYIERRIYSKSLIKVKPNSRYKVVGGLYGWFLFFDKNGNNTMKRVGSLNGVITNEFTTDSNTYYVGLVLHKENNGVTITPSDIPSDLTLQEVAGEIVLRSIGDVKDTLNLTTGEYVQRIGEIVLDGSEQWAFDTKNALPNTIRFYTTDNTFSNAKSSPSNTLNDAGLIDLPTGTSNTDSEHICIVSGRAYIRKNKTEYSDLSIFINWLSSNPITVQYELETPIIKKVNLTNTTKLPSYASTTHYDTIVPSNSLVPNIKISSTVDYNVAIKPSTQYTIRANTTSSMSVDLGGSTGTLTDGKVTLTTPSTLAHNSLKLGNGKVKEVMVIEGSEIKDNVPFFNGMKNVQMGGIKLVNIARGGVPNTLVSSNANGTQYTYTSNGSTSWGNVGFDMSLLKTDTIYTVYMEIVSNTSDNGIKVQLAHGNVGYLNISAKTTGVIKQTVKTAPSFLENNYFALYFRNSSTSGQQVVVKNFMVIEGDWTHLDEIPFIESEMIIEQPIIRSQGKNLFDVHNMSNRGGWHCDKTITNDGKIKLVVNNTDGVAFWQTDEIPVEVGKTYYINISKEGMSSYYMLWANNVKNKSYSNPITITPDIKTISLGLYMNNSVIGNEGTWQIQVEEGSSTTTYEPFKQHTLSSNRVIGYEENCYYAFGGGAKVPNDGINSMLADVEGLSIAYATGGSSSYTFWDKDNVFISGKQYLDTSLSSYDKNGFIAVPSNAKYMRFAAGGETNAQPLYKVATVTGELPLRSLPSGVCDSFNLVTGEYVQRVGEVVLDGINIKPKWIVQSVTNNITSYFDFEKVFTGAKTKSYAFSDKFVYEDYLYNDDRTRYTEGIRIGDEGWGSIRIFNSRLETPDYNGFVKWLQQNPITVQYELDVPIVRKIGLTAKGVFAEASLGDCDWVASPTQTNYPSTTRYRTTSAKSLPIVYNTHLFTEDFDVRHFNIDSHGDYEYISNMEYGQYVNVRKERLESDTVESFKKWLAQNPIKVGYITWKQTSSSYSNIQKPIFFNNVKVQFMNDNVDIQPTLTLQPTSRNSYVMDMMKANTVYTLKALANPNSFTIDGTSYNATTNGTFTSPSTLTNKLLITGQDVYELMIIEGDVTGLTIPYYKGIRSSFDNTDKVEVLSQNKNLFDINGDINEKYSNVIGNFENELLDDGGLKANNWTSEHHGRGQILKLKPNTTYTITGTVKNYGAITIHSKTKSRLLYHSYNNTSFVDKYTTKSDETELCFCFVTQGDVNKEKAIFYNIQIEESPTATPCQPHKENSTIINMPMQLETVDVVKINMLKDMEIGGINHDTGANIDSSTVIRTKNYIPVQPNMQITYCNNGVERATHFIYYDINKNFIGARVYESWMTSKGTITTPDNCYFIRLYHGVTNVDNLTITKKQYKPIALNELPNGVKDELIINRATSSAKLIRRVGKVVLDGQDTWGAYTVHDNNVRIQTTLTNCVNRDTASQVYSVCDKLPSVPWNHSWLMNYNLITVNVCNIHLQLADTSLTKQQMLDWLKRNPITVYYELAEPVVTEIRLKGYPFVYKDGSVQLNTEIPHTTKVKYNVNQEHLINGQNETIIRHDKQIDNLYDYIELYLEEEYRMELFRMQLELSL